MKQVEELRAKFEEYNKQYFSKRPTGLYQPIVYAMDSGGKYIRPLLMIQAAGLFGKTLEDVSLNAYGVELFHNFTLLHDDIMDDSAIRRGKPTVFKQFGLNSGILSGDLMLIISLQLASNQYGKTNPAIMDLVMATAVKILEGQQLDVDFESMSEVVEEEYLTMIEYKTGVLLACSLQMGAMLADASEEAQQKLYEFGRLIGIAFQIQDDYLDAFGDAKVGKRIGGDILNNKKTLLIIASQNKGTASQKSRLNELLVDNYPDEEGKIREVKELIIATGAKDYCIDKMNLLHQEALAMLESIETEESKEALKNIANLIIKRES